MDKVMWLGHDGFVITGEKRIYIDPYNIPEGMDPADIILITHEHYDHCSIKDIMSIADSHTDILVTPDCQSKLSDFPGNVTLVEPNKDYNPQGIKVRSVRAYNTDKRFHPKDNDWVGYIIEMDGRRIYHAGDTDLIPEMDHIHNIDIALLPVSGTFVMNPVEAAKAASMIKPRLAVPMHWGEVVGNVSDAEAFAKAYGGEVEIPQKTTTDAESSATDQEDESHQD
ncbi:MAG: MBL fold metallo-hydrolase [archaeon]